MNRQHALTALALGLMLGGIVSCGGGGGGTVSEGGIGGTGVSLGTITGFGSVFVNGVEYDTNNATIIVDDTSVTEAALRVGMVVRVTGDVNDDGVTGTAIRIDYDEAFEGPVDGAPVANADDTEKTFTIYGVTVVAKRNGTTYSDVSYDTLGNNDMLEVSGFYDANGDLRATHIERQGSYPARTEAEITGVVTNLDPVALTFSIQGTTVTVNYAGADLSDVTGGTLANGMYVEAKGNLTSLTDITATEVEEEDQGLGSDDIDEAELQGIITDYNGDGDFRIFGIPVNASGASREPASLVLADGVEVEVEGAMVNGVFIADEVSAESGDVKLFANISSTNSSDNSITLVIPNVDGSVVVEVNNGTQIEDEIGNVDSPSEVFALTQGTHVEVEGYEGSGNRVIAHSIRIDDPDKYLVQGVVDAWDGGSQLSILGLSFSTAGATSFERADDTAYANEAAFYQDLVVGTDVVKAVDDDLNGTIDEVEYED